VKRSVRLTVNGEAVLAEVEPRLQLAELLRDHLMLTGTHLGCEHGVCGACTVYLDGAPARSCITYAVACEGTDVRTIEGFDEDAVVAELREAFSAEHALQCGYCTPGMLITARDIVLRLPDADEARVRKELAGNLCRCTGYVGIVRAIQRVLAKRLSFDSSRAACPERSVHASTPLRYAQHEREEASNAKSKGSGRTETANSAVTTARQSEGASLERQPVRPERKPQGLESKDEQQAFAAKDTTLHQSFTVDHPRDRVWAFFGRLDEVTSCVPGASVTGTPTSDRVDTTLRVKLGPIVAEFSGTAEVVRDAATYSGVIHGTARDARSSSSTRGEIRYALSEEQSGAATRVDVGVDYTLTGPLAQFGRSGLVQDIAKRMTAAFAQNLEVRLNASGTPPGARQSNTGRTTELNAGSLLVTVVWGRVKALFRSLLGRSR
jgi:aerobic carbon-monoxide dehydrogenase small subunit